LEEFEQRRHGGDRERSACQVNGKAGRIWTARNASNSERS
jgi:hypothetical protein